MFLRFAPPPTRPSATRHPPPAILISAISEKRVSSSTDFVGGLTTSGGLP